MVYRVTRCVISRGVSCYVMHCVFRERFMDLLACTPSFTNSDVICHSELSLCLSSCEKLEFQRNKSVGCHMICIGQKEKIESHRSASRQMFCHLVTLFFYLRFIEGLPNNQ